VARGWRAVKSAACKGAPRAAPCRAMALSARGRIWARRFMQVWVLLGGIMFFAQCVERAQPYLKVIMGKQHAAHEPAPRP